jgi:hypothetical protein
MGFKEITKIKRKPKPATGPSLACLPAANRLRDQLGHGSSEPPPPPSAPAQARVVRGGEAPSQGHHGGEETAVTPFCAIKSLGAHRNNVGGSEVLRVAEGADG